MFFRGEIDNNSDPIETIKKLVSQYACYAHFENALEAKAIVNQYSESNIPKEEIKDIIKNSKDVNELKSSLKEADIHYGVEQIIKENQIFPHPRYIPGEETDPEQTPWKERVKRHNKFTKLENFGLLWAAK